MVSFLVVFAIFSSIAILRQSRWFGMEVGENRHENVIRPVETADSGENKQGDSRSDGDGVISFSADNQMIVNTSSLCRDVQGYAGPVPLEIYVSDDRIDSIHSLANSESPGFFKRLDEEGLTRAFDGKTLAEASSLNVDAVSGATYSSTAYIANVRAGVSYALKNAGKITPPESGKGIPSGWIPSVAAIAVILVGAILPLFHKGKRFRIVLEVLNVAVLGFWTGTFIDFALMTNFFANGLTASLASAIVLLLFVVGFVYPLFGRNGHYCNWVCPYGSLQELAGRCTKKKVRMSPRLIRGLETFRKSLFVVLLCMLWTGVGASWVDYEIFTAFMVKSAGWVVIAVGAAFLLLSVFVQRPFCRFVCPAGTILRLHIGSSHRADKSGNKA